MAPSVLLRTLFYRKARVHDEVWLVNEVAEAAAEWVEDSRATLEMDGPEAAARRKRVELQAAVARARRAGVNVVMAVNVARYEGHLQRQLRQTLDELERLRRAGGPAAPALPG